MFEVRQGYSSVGEDIDRMGSMDVHLKVPTVSFLEIRRHPAWTLATAVLEGAKTLECQPGQGSSPSPDRRVPHKVVSWWGRSKKKMSRASGFLRRWIGRRALQRGAVDRARDTASKGQGRRPGTKVRD